MATQADHLLQGEHNEALARNLSQNLSYKDWLITTAFYAAIHYVESDFATDPAIGHSEMNRPTDRSLHQYRYDLVRRRYSSRCRRSYAKLRDASENVRYLKWWRTQAGQAIDYYSDADALDFLNRHLFNIKHELNIV